MSANAHLDDYHYGVIGNGRSCAIIDPDGTVVFSCLPDFDSGTVFASLLDVDRGGSHGIEMPGGSAVSQHYERHTNILVTEHESADGSAAFRVIDFMPRYTWDGKAGSLGDAPSDIVRVIEPVRGKPTLKTRYSPQLAYARFETHTAVEHGRIKSATSGVLPDGNELYESIYLYTDLPHAGVMDGAELALDAPRFFVISYHEKVQKPDADRVRLMLARTRSYWLLWSARTHRPDRYGEEVLRSALTLKMLQFDPTGALVAAATTSLPETIGETRNWDYRFCWIRDASLTVSVLRKIGHPRMGSSFIRWMLNTVKTKDDNLQIMYGLRGERHLTEETLDHLAGYHGSRPVRIGNAAYSQEQHDIHGVLLDVILQDLHERRMTPESLDRLWTRARSVVRVVLKRWREPDRGIWEIRGDAQHFVFSKVLCWVALDRAIKIARMIKQERWADEHQEQLQTIHDEICAKGWNEDLGAFTQSYGSNFLDASNLLMADFGFVQHRDPRFVSTVELSLKQLCRDGLMYRYRNPDDFGEPKSAFTVCSFWMVKALVSIGRVKKGRAMFERLVSESNPHGLYGEDLDFESRRHLGNFPQAYSHLALIDCAMALAEHDLVGESYTSEDDVIEA